MTSQGAGCCVAMVTANGPGRPLREGEYIRPRATSGLEILLNFIRAVLSPLPFSSPVFLSPFSLPAPSTLQFSPRGRGEARRRAKRDERPGKIAGVIRRRRFAGEMYATKGRHAARRRQDVSRVGRRGMGKSRRGLVTKIATGGSVRREKMHENTRGERNRER